MDLDEFEKIDIEKINLCHDETLTTQQALKVFDNQWYALTYRSARWMDLIGDYGGNELFIVDGQFQHIGRLTPLIVNTRRIAYTERA